VDSNDKLYHDQTKVNQSAGNRITSSLLNRIKDFNEAAKHNLLIDVSGSMEDMVHEEGKSRNEAVSKRQILENLLTKIPDGITKFAFSYTVKEFKGPLPFEGSGTDMTTAFNRMKELGKTEIVLITDGLPDHAPSALQASKGLKIDIIYIGPQPRPKFLEELAGKTGGSFTNINLIKAGATKELESKITLLLNA
jgi:hypothetical protein